MITRAQAEALLTLAESLEACERVGLTLKGISTGDTLLQGLKDDQLLTDLSAMSIRLAVNNLVPKHTGS